MIDLHVIEDWVCKDVYKCAWKRNFPKRGGTTQIMKACPINQINDLNNESLIPFACVCIQ